MLNGIVGFQLLDDGTPLSLGLMLLSAAALFIGTGYIALDAAFSYSGHFDASLTGDNRNLGLYVLYQLAPLVFLVAFFVLETILVLRVLGEKKPMCMILLRFQQMIVLILVHSIPHWCRPPFCHRTNFSVCDQHTYLFWNKRQDQWSLIRDILHPACGHHDVGLLVKYNRRRLADACIRGCLYLMTAAGSFLCCFDD